MQKFLDKNKGKPVCDEIIEFFFKIRHFINMYDCIDEKYVIYAEHIDDGDFALHLYCVDPSGQLSQRLSQGISTIMFSATLLPVNYFKEMLSGDVSERAVYAHSSFEPDNKRIVVATDVTSRYTRRNAREYAKVHDYIMHMISGRSGRYMVFFPSYSYMESVLECFRWENGVNVVECGGEDTFLPESCVNVLVQGRFMKEADKEKFLSAFYEELPEGASLAGFCVLGGIFSEGIDLKDESLIGAVIVGTGIPMVCRERNILRDYFDEFGKNGYSYAYVIPGMNKVLQAAGRVIRTDTDKGVIALLDDRFMTGEYERMYPREWNRIFPVSLGNAYKCIKDFWTEQDI
jgi:Rad3-related DNA helicase